MHIQYTMSNGEKITQSTCIDGCEIDCIEEARAEMRGNLASYNSFEADDGVIVVTAQVVSAKIITDEDEDD